MATHKGFSTHKSTSEFTYRSSTGHSFPGTLWAKYLAFADAQKPNSIAWWLGSLMLHGCILVPVTFLLVYSLNGPTAAFLGISMTLFFINVIANMGSAPFRITLFSFILSIIIHIMMVASVLLIQL